MAALDDSIKALTDEATQVVTVDGSAKVVIDGINTRIQTAVDAALAAGATPAQLDALNSLITSLKSGSDPLAASVAANTPGGPVVAPRKH